MMLSAMSSKLPREPGSYALLLYLPQLREIAVGRLGSLHFIKGYYLYLGSAFGPGGLKARLGRHLAENKKIHWHIDYLRQYAKVKEVWMAPGTLDMEHHWAGYLSAGGVACDPVVNFGSSDCHCKAHLFQFPRRPDPVTLSCPDAGLPPITIESLEIDNSGIVVRGDGQ